jgi:Lipase (class 3)
MSASLTQRMFAAARSTYLIRDGGDSLDPESEDYRTVDWLNGGPHAFVAGLDRIDAGIAGEIDAGVLCDFDALMVPPTAFSGKFLVHQGFNDALVKLLKAGLPLIETLIGGASDTKPIYVTGHSKGGALANLAAYFCKSNWPSRHVFLTTFAAPRCGDADYQAAFDTLVPHSVRYEAQDDIVPHLPPNIGFKALLNRLPVLRSRLDGLTHGYASVDTLKFIDWSSKIVGDSPILELHRLANLAGLMIELDFAKIVRDHTLDAGGVYAGAPYP